MQTQFVQSECITLKKKKANIKSILRAQPQRYLTLLQKEDHLHELKNTEQKIQKEIEKIASNLEDLQKRLNAEKHQQLTLVIQKEELQLMIKNCAANISSFLQKGTLKQLKAQLLLLQFQNLGNLNFRKAICQVYRTHCNCELLDESSQIFFSLSQDANYQSQDQHEETKEMQLGKITKQISQNNSMFMHQKICQLDLINLLKEQMNSKIEKDQQAAEKMQVVKLFCELMYRLQEALSTSSSKAKYQGSSANKNLSVFHEVDLEFKINVQAKKIKTVRSDMKSLKQNLGFCKNRIQHTVKQIQSFQSNLHLLKVRRKTITKSIEQSQNALFSLQNRYKTFEEMKYQDLAQIDEALAYLNQKKKQSTFASTKSLLKKKSLNQTATKNSPKNYSNHKTISTADTIHLQFNEQSSKSFKRPCQNIANQTSLKVISSKKGQSCSKDVHKSTERTQLMQKTKKKSHRMKQNSFTPVKQLSKDVKYSLAQQQQIGASSSALHKISKKKLSANKGCLRIVRSPRNCKEDMKHFWK